MASKKVLGRGLGVYFPEYGQDDKEPGRKDAGSAKKENKAEAIPASERVNVVLDVPVNHIRANPYQPRTEFDEERLKELAESIKQHGLIQPLTVRYLGEKRFELISGERRLRAAKLAGMDEIPAYIREADDEQSMAFALIENIQREDLSALEVALAYKRLLEEFEYTQAQVAEKVGKSRVTVTNMLRLLTLPDFIQSALKKELISMGHARALVAVESEHNQKKLLKQAIAHEWSVRQIEEAVRDLSAPSAKRKKTPPVPRDPFYADIESRLRKKFSTKVELKPGKNGGEIKIEYYTDEDLERLLNLIDSL